MSNLTSGQYNITINTSTTHSYNFPTITSSSLGTTGTYGFTNQTSQLTVKGDAEFEGDIKWKGKSLGKLLEDIETRLLILQPNFEKLEKYPALKNAYEHYKLMEKLIGEN